MEGPIRGMTPKAAEVERLQRVLGGPPALSRDLLDILLWSSHGLDDLQIAVILNLPHSTVKERAKRTLRALAARNRPHAVAIALRLGLMA